VSTTSGVLGPGNGRWLRAVTSGPLDALGEVRRSQKVREISGSAD
jgi:hypothetical protein